MEQEAKRWKALYEQMRRKKQYEVEMLNNEIHDLKVANFRFSCKIYGYLESMGLSPQEIFSIMKG